VNVFEYLFHTFTSTSQFGKKLWPTVVFRSAEGVYRNHADEKWKREEPDIGIHFRDNRGTFSLVEPSKIIQCQIDKLELVESQSTAATEATAATIATVATAATATAALATPWKKKAKKEKRKHRKC
jgi:hypothetical protein